MAIESMPLFGAGETSYRYTVTIGTVAYIIDMTYAERHDAWYLSIYDKELVPLRTGIRVVIGWPLTGRDIQPEMIEGLLIALRMDDQGTKPPTIGDFDGAVTLLLVTGDDLPQSETASDALRIEAVI